MINIRRNVPLSEYSTMRLGGKAAYLAEAYSVEDIISAADFANKKAVSLLMIGVGSNIIWLDEGFSGFVLVNKISGLKIQNVDKGKALISVGSGENWDKVVAKTVEKNLSGIEQLSKIPGTAGATPVQNVGAYGREISDVLVSLEAYDLKKNKVVIFENKDCSFSYRSSKFKTTEKGRFLISSITLELEKANPKPPFYPEIQTYFDKNKIKTYTPIGLREAIIEIRNSKLPNPDTTPNSGSFFLNPVVSEKEFKRLKKLAPEIPGWKESNGHVKLSASWLIEQAGLKDFYDKKTGISTNPGQSLVLINRGARSTSDLLKFKKMVVKKVHDLFGVNLEQEPEIITNS